LPGLALNLNPPDLFLLSSWDYRREIPMPGSNSEFEARLDRFYHEFLILTQY
jgi:hypothetical protein